MNIEKVKKYNQKLLAVLGTIVALMALIGLISTLYFVGMDIGSSFGSKSEDGILSDETIELLQKENKRQQIISYQIPELVDTVNLIYMIPVSQKTLNNPENIEDNEVLGLLDMSGGKFSSKGKYRRSYYGSYNNLLIYDAKTEKLNKLFDDRVNFEKIDTKYFEDDVFITFKASNADSYKDGIINSKDLKKLYIYSVREQKLKDIGLNHADVIAYKFINESKNLLVQFGVDYNKDGKYDSSKEPKTLRSFNYKSGVLSEIVSKDIHSQLQKKLEGSSKE
ncbi:MAG: hypothetical protein JKX79_11420 [Labilibaculum sp.]|nr:hypothetical protein [Labilibaculum sp.]